MNDKFQQYCATDKEIHDLYKSGKRKLTESVLLELAKDRGIFYSASIDRDALIERLSTQLHDYYDVAGVIERRAATGKRDKTTSVTLDIELSIEEIKEVVSDYQQEMIHSEKVSSQKRGADKLVMNLDYNEYDYSRTRLIQRQPKEATLEFVTKEGVTTVRMPATEKARSVLDSLKDKLEIAKKIKIPTHKIELSELSDSEDRTIFFTRLIDSIENYSLQTVTNIKVASNLQDADDSFDDDDELNEPARQDMLAVVHSVALNGENLVASEQYQQLRAGGFFITAITWRSRDNTPPHDLIQFDASFENPVEGTGFKYGVRVATRKKDGEYVKSFKPVGDFEKARLFGLIESSARRILKDILSDSNSETQQVTDSGETEGASHEQV